MREGSIRQKQFLSTRGGLFRVSPRTHKCAKGKLHVRVAASFNFVEGSNIFSVSNVLKSVALNQVRQMQTVQGQKVTIRPEQTQEFALIAAIVECMNGLDPIAKPYIF